MSIESAETISATWLPSESLRRRATSTARAVLPPAVGPMMMGYRGGGTATDCIDWDGERLRAPRCYLLLVPPLPALKNPTLARLEGHLRARPRAVLLEDLARAEDLAGQLESTQTYPEDWVYFRITGTQLEAGRP